MSFEAERSERDRFFDEILALAAVIEVDPAALPAREREADAYEPYWLDVRGFPPNFVYSLFYEERGERQVLAESIRGDDVMEAIFKRATQSAATRIELQHRRPDEDSRRQWFALQAEMMERLKPEWGQRLRAHQNIILQRSPFDDKT